MEEAFCDVCKNEYDESNIVPRVLECGHSICSVCIKKVIETSKLCPKCRNTISKNTIGSFPINYSLLGFKDSRKKRVCEENILYQETIVLKKRSIATETELVKKKMAVDHNVNQITDGLTQITGVLSELDELSVEIKKDDGDLEAAKETLADLKKKLQTIHRIQSIGLTNTLNLSDYESSTAFLLQIYNGLVRGEHFYTVKNVDGQVQYGRISFSNNQLCFHAFGCTRMNITTNLIQFQDIQTCLDEIEFYTFLDITCNDDGIIQRIFIKMLSTVLTPQFIKFCTGENGPTYKGCSFSQGKEFIGTFLGRADKYNIKSIIDINKPQLGDKVARECKAYSAFELSHECSHGNIFLTTVFDGSFKIRQLNSSNFNEPILINQMLSFAYDEETSIRSCSSNVKIPMNSSFSNLPTPKTSCSSNVQIPNVIGLIVEPTNLASLVTYGKKNIIVDSGIVLNM